MTCLKNKIILFLLGFIATMQIGIAFRTERLIKIIEEFEPVVIEQIIEVMPEVESKTESVPEIEIVPESTVVPPKINCRLDDEIQQMIIDKCAEYNIDFAFTMAVIFKESSFKPNADSGSSVGLMQINRINHEWLSKELGITNFFDPEQNVTAGLYILQQLFNKYDDPTKVLMAYNMGETGAKRLWNKGIYTSDYAEGVLQQAEIYKQEIEERMGLK